MTSREVPMTAAGAGPEILDSMDIGPVKPSADVQADLARLLDEDQSVLGGVYRGIERGLTAEAIATELEASTSGFVSNYRRIMEALLEGKLPKAPTVAVQVARRFRSILKSKQLSPVTRDYLERNLSELERLGEDQFARVAEVQVAQEETEKAESRNEVGIYVYALPHYIRYPYDQASGRTLMKVGHSASDVIQRFRNHRAIHLSRLRFVRACRARVVWRGGGPS